MRQKSKLFFYFFLTYLTMCVFIPNCFAGTMGAQLQRYFNSVGGGSNATAPSTYKNQAAGYYNGGSFYGRVPVQSAQLGHIFKCLGLGQGAAESTPGWVVFRIYLLNN